LLTKKMSTIAKRDSIIISSVIGMASRKMARSIFPERMCDSSPANASRKRFQIEDIFLRRKPTKNYFREIAA